MQSFAERFKIAIAESGKKPSEIAQITHINKSNISYYLNGKVVPKIDKVILFAKLLEVSAEWLLGYDVPKKYTSDTTLLSPVFGIPYTKSDLDIFIKYLNLPVADKLIVNKLINDLSK